MKKKKVTILTPLPAPYREPLFERLSKIPDWDLQVYYCTAGTDTNLGWQGQQNYVGGEYTYKREILKNVAPECCKGIRLIGYVNPSILWRMFKKKPNYLIIQGCAQFTEIMAIIWAIVTRTPFALWSDSNYYLEQNKSSWKKKLKRIYLKPIIRCAHGILTIGTANELYWRFYGAKTNQCYLAKYAVENDFFAWECRNREIQAKELRKTLGLEGKTVFLYVGRLVKIKGIDLLIDAFRQLTQKRSDVGLLIVGNGEERESLEARAAMCPPGSVAFVGRVDYQELPLYIGCGDVLVVPSWKEPWGLVINEGMACGLPVIASQECGGAVDLVRDNENGICLSELNVSYLYGAMEQLADSATRRLRMGRRSEEIIAPWTYEESVSGFLDMVSSGIK